MIASPLRKAINSQVYLCNSLDRLFPERFCVDGNTNFRNTLVPRYLRPNLKIYDVGGGKHPYIREGTKADLGLTVVGLDIDRDELGKAPQRTYDEVVCADITEYEGRRDADLIICQAVLEHVKDVDKAFAAMASILKPGGRALIFVPSRNTLYARLNLMMPEVLKKKLLFAIFPSFRSGAGFPCYYDRCTPRNFRALAGRHGLEVEEERLYFWNGYFSCFVPAYLAWRLWSLFFHLMAEDQSAESFSMALKKHDTTPMNRDEGVGA